ncbi:hypothetical protein BST81_13170 [Leptolyngbya sp. 'hensonii']|uniref:GUN4 domain-containing protein n=1 Tax=Leptolyngbya sp. 'hensonii' TaxID=1922337 RepID=UPI00095033A8|nr:GUN4 domain-containing protein [Leptolyngbya sp. 'hensonii']OLP17989.1 hypothetical protein BST81_13170 [Leptolyngbya sp. 'hensonii']
MALKFPLRLSLITLSISAIACQPLQQSGSLAQSSNIVPVQASQSSPSSTRVELPPALPSTTTPVSVELKIGTRYRKLKDLLGAGKFKEADLETRRLMLQIAPLDQPDSDRWRNWTKEKIPCSDLITINALWEQYSNGHFGWAIQNRIFLEERQKDSKDPVSAFWRRVGWAVIDEPPGSLLRLRILSYDNLTFNLQAPKGHLPTFALWTGQQGGITGWFWDRSLAPRLKACKV